MHELPERGDVPRWLLGPSEEPEDAARRSTCPYCGVADSAALRADGRLGPRLPTAGCRKMLDALGPEPTLYPIHTEPSVLLPDGTRRAVSYEEAVERLAALVVRHASRPHRTSVYACGQVDLFAIFAVQEVFRLLGVRNLGGNAEHCLNSGAVHNEMLTGQEGPFLTIDQAFARGDRLFLLNGWNGLITHPGVFRRLLARPDLDAWIVDVVESESVRAVTQKLGQDRALLIRPATDPHLALGVAHELLVSHPLQLDRVFLGHWSQPEPLRRFRELAGQGEFAAKEVARRIAPEAHLAERIERGIRGIAARLAESGTPAINISSVGLSQTRGVVGHCLWGNALALVGKYGVRPDGSPAGGPLRLPGQVNAQSEIQGLSRDRFFGRLPMDEAGAEEAAVRMGLPHDAYERALREPSLPVLDYGEPLNETLGELFVCLGTQFESTMPERRRLASKLRSGDSRLVVVDPVPGPFAEAHADLIIPAPPHAASGKLYLSGEWRMTVSCPARQAAPETRTDATLIYDVMASVCRRLRRDPRLRAARPDLARLQDSGYLSERFLPLEEDGGLPRWDGEVDRSVLWDRMQANLGAVAGAAALYCRAEHGDGTDITWSDLVRGEGVLLRGVGATRFLLDPDRPFRPPFADLHRRPQRFRFFVPEDRDLRILGGTRLVSGRSVLSDDPARRGFALRTFNSGKATPAVGMPERNHLHVSPAAAKRLGIEDGSRVAVVSPRTGARIEREVTVSARVPGDTAYLSFHKSREELETGSCVNDVTSHQDRCPYTSQTALKATEVLLEPLG